ncbi:hypothetical protein AcW2_005843 [Taiwanofungus camphoratus]|nr:hypothetical protein AcW2_005843 [Antrodia cinnamomea]
MEVSGVWLLRRLITCRCCAAGNVTIDDTYGDEITGQQPIYTPSSDWDQGEICTGCALHPNPLNAFYHTWHDSTYAPTLRPGIPTITLLFSGTAIYIFCIVPTTSPFNSEVETGMQLIFTLDNQPAGQFVHDPDNSSVFDYAYNFPVYVNESLAIPLPGIQHNLTIQSFLVNLFDYAIYTTPEEDVATTMTPTSGISTTVSPNITIISSSEPTGTASTRSPSHTPIGAVIGGAVGGTLALAALLLLAFTYRRCSGNHIRPFNTDSLARRIEPFNGAPVTARRAPGLHTDPDGTGGPRYDNSIIPPTSGGSASQRMRGPRKHHRTPAHATQTSLLPDRELQAQMRELRVMMEQVQAQGRSLQTSHSHSMTEPLPDYNTAVGAGSPYASQRRDEGGEGGPHATYE